MSEPTHCNTCRWWNPNVARSGLGECRRFPPQHAFDPSGGGHNRVSPVTGAYFWCGEHADRGEKIATGQDEYAETAGDDIREARAVSTPVAPPRNPPLYGMRPGRGS